MSDSPTVLIYVYPIYESYVLDIGYIATGGERHLVADVHADGDLRRCRTFSGNRCWFRTDQDIHIPPWHPDYTQAYAALMAAVHGAKSWDKLLPQFVKDRVERLRHA